MHALQQLIREVNSTHKGLGPMIAMNLVAAKAKRCILNIAPAGCGKSVTTDSVTNALGQNAIKYTSLTLAGLKQISNELNQFSGHIIIDDLGAEKSEWARVSTVTVLSTLVHTHSVKKVTQGYVIEICNFYGSAALNIQPVMMQSIVGDNDWIAVIRDKVIRYYHLYRPIKPVDFPPKFKLNWNIPLVDVEYPKKKGKLWYQLMLMALVQWSYARALEHIPALLRACAALDGRTEVKESDYHILMKLMKPMLLERYLIESYGLESGRTFNNNLFCLLVELATHGEPTIETVCEDYKVSPQTIYRVASELAPYVWIKSNSPKRLMPMDVTKEILKICGAYQKW